jgi:hypothetical protein
MAAYNGVLIDNEMPVIRTHATVTPAMTRRLRIQDGRPIHPLEIPVSNNWRFVGDRGLKSA